MKKAIICITLASTTLFTSCIGSFSAFNGLRDWNESVTDNQFGNEVIFLALWIIPVYQLATLGDLIVFNAIEFWGGDNPIAMKEGDSETRIVKSKGNTYQITATKNRFHVAIIEGKRKGETSDLIYAPEDKSWSAIKANGEKVKLTSLKKGLRMVHLPNGESIHVQPGMSKVATVNYLDQKLATYDLCEYAELD
ncbi:DUF3332 domain-containing protein [Aquimarina agarilytica]|uniref:DUF3332 domain-containing protein n=1 Tax=Aquimarina agarilytica TaxID=1087449 RepID=UPI000287EB73|nr:DUF3332 domain-containing protein [Aquimarina agarilytica]